MKVHDDCCQNRSKRDGSNLLLWILLLAFLLYVSQLHHAKEATTTNNAVDQRDPMRVRFVSKFFNGKCLDTPFVTKEIRLGSGGRRNSRFDPLPQPATVLCKDDGTRTVASTIK